MSNIFAPSEIGGNKFIAIITSPLTQVNKLLASLIIRGSFNAS